MNIGLVIALIKKLAPGVDPSTIEQAVQDWLNDHPEATTTVQDGSITEEKLAAELVETLTNLETDVSDVKNAIHQVGDINKAIVSVFQHIAFTDAGGKTAYDTLYALVYGTPQHELVSISASFDSSAIVYAWEDLDTLKDNLTVLATYSDSQTPEEVTTGYTLSGSLSAGNNTITVTYEGKTTTVTVFAYDFAFTAGYVNGTNNSTQKKVQIKSNTARLLCDSSVGVTPLNDDSGQATSFYPMPIRPDITSVKTDYPEGYRRSIVIFGWSENLNDFVQISGSGWANTHENIGIESAYRDGNHYCGVTFSGENGTEDMSNVDTSEWKVVLNKPSN